MTESAKYLVGYGWREDYEFPEPMTGFIWTERWDGAYVQQKDRLQESLPFIRTRHEGARSREATQS